MGAIVHRPSLVRLDDEGADGAGRLLLPDQDLVTLGRSLDADVVFADAVTLSRRHVRLERGSGGWALIDLGSANGTRLNGVLASGLLPLAPGDEIACGTVRLRFEMIEDDRLDADELAPVADLTPLQEIRTIAPDGSGPALPPLAGLSDGKHPPPITTTRARPSRIAPTQPDLPMRRRKTLPLPPKDGGTLSSGAGDGLPELPLRDALVSVPLFRRLSPDLLVTMADAMTERRYKHGADIVREGDDGNTLFVMLSGQARVHRAGAAGEDVELARLGPGGFFGEMSLLDGQPRSATVRATTDVRCALLPRWALESLIRANPLIAMQMLAVLSIRLRAVERLLAV